LRGGGEAGAVPMTKSEVRAVCLSKLQLTEDAVCWDVGAGTGSVSVEMALLAKKGTVYAVERREDALALLEENKAAFGVENLIPVAGVAPECCEKLPAPTHAFIGGSSGNLREIVALLLEKNPGVRIVAAAVTLESAAELTGIIKEYNFTEHEIVSLTVARDRRAGRYHLMTGQNPVYLFTMQREAAV
jgi:precorrin-6Y C5,15-methyltransferase (decarboxylating), CbiT subunit